MSLSIDFTTFRVRTFSGDIRSYITSSGEIDNAGPKPSTARIAWETLPDSCDSPGAVMLVAVTVTEASEKPKTEVCPGISNSMQRAHDRICGLASTWRESVIKAVFRI